MPFLGHTTFSQEKYLLAVIHKLHFTQHTQEAQVTYTKLQEACQQQQYNRGIEDLELWLSEIEGQLQSEDYGKLLSRSNTQELACKQIADINNQLI